METDKKRRILIIDDEAALGDMIKTNLEATGKYEAKAESSGKGGLKQVEEFRPHLIILDIMMPDMRGTDVAGKIMLDEKTNAIPIVFLTALARKGAGQLQGGLVNGALFVAKPALSKPIKMPDLIACIEETFARKDLFIKLEGRCQECRLPIKGVNDSDMKNGKLAHKDCQRAMRQEGVSEKKKAA